MWTVGNREAMNISLDLTTPSSAALLQISRPVKERNLILSYYRSISWGDTLNVALFFSDWPTHEKISYIECGEAVSGKRTTCMSYMLSGSYLFFKIHYSYWTNELCICHRIQRISCWFNSHDLSSPFLSFWNFK